jgi:hypothetical protein
MKSRVSFFSQPLAYLKRFSVTISIPEELVIDPLQPRKGIVIYRSANSAKAIKMHWCAFCLFYGMNVLVLFLLASNA